MKKIFLVTMGTALALSAPASAQLIEWTDHVSGAPDCTARVRITDFYDPFGMQWYYDGSITLRSRITGDSDSFADGDFFSVADLISSMSDNLNNACIKGIWNVHCRYGIHYINHPDNEEHLRFTPFVHNCR